MSTDFARIQAECDAIRQGIASLPVARYPGQDAGATGVEVLHLRVQVLATEMLAVIAHELRLARTGAARAPR